MSSLSTTLAQAASSTSVFGEVSPPPGVAAYDTAAGGIGLILFLSNLIKVITIAGGIFVMVNILYAGIIYLNASGDTGAHKKVIDTITFSVLGLAIIVGSYAAAALAGVIFFGDATFILSPTICGPEGC